MNIQQERHLTIIHTLFTNNKVVTKTNITKYLNMCLKIRQFRFLHVVQLGTGAHPVTYPMDTLGFIPGDKSAEA
jgi:hypothetical protein